MTQPHMTLPDFLLHILKSLRTLYLSLSRFPSAAVGDASAKANVNQRYLPSHHCPVRPHKPFVRMMNVLFHPFSPWVRPHQPMVPRHQACQLRPEAGVPTHGVMYLTPASPVQGPQLSVRRPKRTVPAHTLFVNRKNPQIGSVSMFIVYVLF